MIKLLTPSPVYTDEFNAWLQSIPSYIYAMVFIIKALRAGMGRRLGASISALDIVNGFRRETN